MLIDYAAITHQGRVRKNNEDAYLVSALEGKEPHVNTLSRTPKVCRVGLLAAVADGMGGAAAGEIASREGLASIAVCLFGHWGRFPASTATEEGPCRSLLRAAEEASAAVLRYSDAERTARGMGSTLTATVLWNGHLYLCQVGDSRAYLYRRPQMLQLTRDQTLVNDLIQAGSLTRDQARSHPQRSMITQYEKYREAQEKAAAPSTRTTTKSSPAQTLAVTLDAAGKKLSALDFETISGPDVQLLTTAMKGLQTTLKKTIARIPK